MTEFTKVIEWNRTKTILWWLLFLLCLAYAGFAFEMFRGELIRALDAAVSTETKVRESPIAFMLHAIMGGVGLVSGALQFNSAIRRRSIAVHRTFGWIYLLSIWGASTTGIWNAIHFDVPETAKLVFLGVGTWWFFSTSLAYWYVRRRMVSLHKSWMIRSYAISLFFITFPIWVPWMQMLMQNDVAWPVGLLLAVLLNALAAEIWIRRV